MKAIIQPVHSQSTYAKLLEWGKLVTITGGAQSLIQGVNLLSGILTIRLLSTQEYALYTLANTMLATMTLLADGGISTGVMAQGSKVWYDKEKLGQVMVTGLKLRKLFALCSSLVSIPLLLYLLIHNGANWLNSSLIVMALIPGFFAALSNAHLQIAPKLHQDIIVIQRNQLTTSLIRFSSLCLSIFILPYSAVAIFISGFPQVWSNIHLRKISSSYVDWSQKANSEIQEKMLNLVKQMLPGIIYYCLSGQITIWLVSIFGSTKAVAQLGALGRFSMVMNIFNILFNTLILPRYARSTQSKKIIIKQFLLIIIGLIIISLGTIAFFWLFSDQLLLILGPNYLHLNKELVLSMSVGCLHLIFGSAFLLNTSKGWVVNQFLFIFLEIITLVTSCLLFDVSTLEGVLSMQILVATIQLIMHMSFFFYKTLHLSDKDLAFQKDIDRI